MTAHGAGLQYKKQPGGEQGLSAETEWLKNLS
jgi:hypothetical protein